MSECEEGERREAAAVTPAEEEIETETSEVGVT